MNLARISSPKVEVYWAGWRSDTFRLQENGWQLSAEQDIPSMRFRFAIKHPNFRIYGLTQLMDYREYVEFKDDVYRQYKPMVIQHMVSRMEIRTTDDLKDFSPIDAEPQFNVDFKAKDIEDFMIFRPINKAKEIIVPEFEVPELLSMILQKQDPKQAELRDKKRKQWRKFTREINEANPIMIEQEFDNRNQIMAQLVCVR